MNDTFKAIPAPGEMSLTRPEAWRVYSPAPACDGAAAGDEPADAALIRIS